MMLNGSEEKLFSKSVPISIRDEYTNQSRLSHLFLTMEWQDASAMLYSKKVLSVSLTDENDPFFLYTLNLSEEEFETLKNSQDLRINFVEFPQHIIAYINKCLDEEKNPQPKFLLVFSINEKLGNAASSPKFDIIETNQFKKLTYLSLKFVNATESAVRQYITTYLRNLKENNLRLQNKSTFLEQDLKNQSMTYQQTLTSKDQELELLRKELDVKLSMKDSKHAEELQEERNRLLNRLKEQKMEHEKERKDTEIYHQHQVQTLESKANTLDILNTELHKKNSQHETTIRELKLKVISLEDELKMLKDDVQTYKKKYDNMYSEAQSKQLQIQDLDGMIMVLKNKLQSKDQNIEQLTAQIEKGDQIKKKLEEKLDLARRQYDASERSVKSLERDKEELNSVVLNLQDKIKKLKSKIDVDAKYKYTIEEKEKMLQDMKKKALDLDSLLEAKNVEINSLNAEVNYLNEEMSKCKASIHDRDNVISYLHRQMAENYIVPTAKNDNVPMSDCPLISPSILAKKKLEEIGSSVTGKMSSPDNRSPNFTSNRTATKSVSITTPSQKGNKKRSTLSQFHKTEGTDSAYYTSPSCFSNQMTPETFPHPNKPNAQDDLNPDLDKDFDVDPEALSAAFGNSNPVIKHSTAKKQTKPAKSTPSRTVKKR